MILRCDHDTDGRRARRSILGSKPGAPSFGSQAMTIFGAPPGRGHDPDIRDTTRTFSVCVQGCATRPAPPSPRRRQPSYLYGRGYRPAANKKSATPRILVVDDEELARFTIREILTKAGHEIDEAENGDEAIKRQKAEPFDLIVTDIIMPGKDGVETIAELKRDDPRPTVLAISASRKI